MYETVQIAGTLVEVKELFVLQLVRARRTSQHNFDQLVKLRDLCFDSEESLRALEEFGLNLHHKLVVVK